MKTKKKQNKKKRCSLSFSLVFGRKVDEDKKKKKKKVFSQILFVFVLKLSAQITKGGTMQQFYMLFSANYVILATQWGGMAHALPPKYAPVNDIKFEAKNDHTVDQYW